MLSHIQMLKTFADMSPNRRIIPQPQDTSLFVFPNCTTGALMCVECSPEVGPEVELLLMCAHVHRKHSCLPADVLPACIAAKMIGISRSTLRRWVAKGWIRAWSKQAPIEPMCYPAAQNEAEPNGPGVASGYFCAMEVKAYRLAKPRAL